jgi:choline-sulfatase
MDLRNAVVILISDHGEEFQEHGGYWHLRGLHQELNRVLFSIRAPGLAPQRIAHNVSLVDLLPTVLELVGISPPEKIAGWSLLPLMKGDDSSVEARFANRVLFAHRTEADDDGVQVWKSALQGQWKLIDGPSGRSLYDHSRDFFEQNDLIASESLRNVVLEQALDNFQRQLTNDDGEGAQFLLEKGMLEELRTLGYVE